MLVPIPSEEKSTIAKVIKVIGSIIYVLGVASMFYGLAGSGVLVVLISVLVAGINGTILLGLSAILDYLYTIATNKYVDDKDLDADYEANKHPLLLLAKQNEDK